MTVELVGERPVSLPVPTRTPGGAGATPATPAPSMQDGMDLIRFLFSQAFGGQLTELAEEYWNAYLNDTPLEVIIEQIRRRPEHERVFPGFTKARAKDPRFTEATWIASTRGYVQELRARGVRPGFYDEPEDFRQWIEGEVRPDELGGRLDLWQTWERETRDPVAAEEYRRQAAALGWEVTDGDFLMLALDPERAVTTVERSLSAAGVATEAVRAGFGQLGVDESLRLVDQGVSASQARQGFGALVDARELFSALPGEAGDTLTRQEQVGAVFGTDAAARRRVERRGQERRAAFEGGGGFSTGGGGLAGLRSAE